LAGVAIAVEATRAWARRQPGTADEQRRERGAAARTTGLRALTSSGAWSRAAFARRSPASSDGRGVDGGEELFVSEGLAQERGRAALHRQRQIVAVVERGDEDDRQIDALLVQPGLDVEAGHALHADVEDEARRPVRRQRLQEFRSRGGTTRLRSAPSAAGA
jgi:hypothetical protein